MSANMIEIDVFVSACNEEQTVAATLKSIAGQKLPANIFLRVMVVVNGCTDGTMTQAQHTIEGLGKLKHATFMVEETAGGSKNKAMDYALERTGAPLVFCVDADVTFSPGCFAAVAKVFEQPGVMVSGAEPDVVIPEALASTILGQLYRVRQIEKEVAGGSLRPFGQFMAFRRGAIKAFPLDFVGADNTWLAYVVASRYGWKAVQMAVGAKVLAQPPQNWLDLMRQESRWQLNAIRLLRHYPEFVPVANELWGRRLVSRFMSLERRRRVLSRMRQEAIAPEIMDLNDSLLPEMLRENAVLMSSKLARADGHWEAVASTKVAV
jgi:glycosyltransferase involved in cell wall biosynthesis